MQEIRLMIVEDEIIIAMDLKRRLLQLGYSVIAMVSAGEECLRKIGESKPDLILMDIILRGEMDGIAAAELIKKSYNIPIVYLTAHADEKTLGRAKITEPYGYILKPFESKDIQSIIEIAMYKHKMEKLLAESEIKYRTLILTATDAVLTLNEDGIVTSFNPKVLSLFGFEESEMAGVSIKKLLPDVFINHLAEGIKRFLSVGRPVTGDTLELYGKRKDGSSFPIELSFSQWTVNQNHHFTLIIRDITKRKEAEVALKRAHDELEERVQERTHELNSLINQSLFAICVFDITGRPVFVNAAWNEMWQNNLDYLISTGYNLMNDRLLERYNYLDKIKKLFIEGGSFKTKPLYFDPEEYPALMNSEGSILVFSYYAVLNEKKRVFRVVCFVEDITERVKAEETTHELQAQKNRSALMLDKLEEERCRISRELHDSIGQILYAAKFNLEVFEKSSLTENKQIAEAKNLISTAGRELKSIIYSLHPIIIDNYGLTAALDYLCKEFAQTTGIKPEFNIGGIEGRLESRTELNVYRIVQEAFNNISKHAKAGAVQLKLFFDEGTLTVMIKDNGIGFDNMEMDDTKNGNISFGIINMTERAEMMGGDFQIESSQGKGTEIRVKIPIE